MDFDFDEHQESFREQTRRFLERSHPLSKTRETLEEAVPFDRAAWHGGAALGWTAPFIPEAHGGGLTTQPLVDLVVVAEEIGRSLYPGPFLSTNVVAFAIISAGDDAQRSAWLPRIASGEAIASWCFTEDGSCDLAEVGVEARSEGEDAVLTGTSRFVPDADVADLVLVTARSGDGIAQYLVPRSTGGIDVRPLRTLDLTRRLCEVRFDGVRIPAASQLPPREHLVQRLLDVATVLLCAETVGAAERLFEMTVEYAKVRVQFGRPIGSFQAIKHKLADMLIDLEGSRAATHYAALAVADGLSDAAAAVSTAKSHVGDATSHLAGEALQTHGGIGFTWEHDLHLYLRRIKGNQNLYGDPAWHRERLCALALA